MGLDLLGVAREPIATFTPTGITHPDEIWNPRGSELAPPRRPFSPIVDYREAESERPVQREHIGETPIVGNVVSDTSGSVRAALRPGAI